MHTIVEQLANSLVRYGLHLVTAESCTGGWIAKTCTDVPGSSIWFEGGVVSYSNELKQALLSVPKQTLDTFGAVSEEVAEQMALGARKLMANPKRTVALAVTGIAGPSGGTEEKPVGTVCFAWVHGDKILAVETNVFSGDRSEVRSKTVEHGLLRLVELLG